MINLVYTSTAAHQMEESELLTLLKEARDRNERQNVTGMLLYGTGSFYQVLEGEKKDVEEIYQSIVKDNRNHSNIIILKGEIDERSFPNWSMGFKDLRKETSSYVDGYTDFMNLSNKHLQDNYLLMV